MIKRSVVESFYAQVSKAFQEYEEISFGISFESDPGTEIWVCDGDDNDPESYIICMQRCLNPEATDDEYFFYDNYKFYFTRDGLVFKDVVRESNLLGELKTMRTDDFIDICLAELSEDGWRGTEEEGLIFLGEDYRV